MSHQDPAASTPTPAPDPPAPPVAVSPASGPVQRWAYADDVDWYRSAMHFRLGLLVRLLLVPLFAKVRFDDRAVARIREVAAEGTPVYVMRTASLLDYLYFNYAFLEKDLPLARFSNSIHATFWGPWRGAWTLLAKGLRYLEAGRLPDPVTSGYLRDLVAAGRPTLLFLRRLDTPLRRLLRRHTQADVVPALIEAQRSSPSPIFLIPQLMVWDRIPDRTRKGFLDVLFGDREGPGPIRKVGRFLLNHRRAFVVVGEPINLKLFLEQEGDGRSDAVLARMLRRVLQGYLYRERRVVKGPNMRFRPDLLARVARDGEVQATLEAVSTSDGRPRAELERKVARYLDRIAADLSMSMIDFADYILRRVFHRLYDEIVVDEAGLDRLRAASRHATVVLVPCHRSHIDYLLLSYVLYNHDLAVPHIAAGINLSFWPMGTLFRKMGAFFVQRSFKGDTLSPVVFKKYLWALLGEGVTIEFFIEGGRSRSGRFLQPKLGMLSMIADYHTSMPRLQDITIVPVSLSYERVVEVKSYVHELEGGEKQRENLSQVLQSSRHLRHRYGKVYVGFLEPISLSDYLREQARPYRPDLPWEERRAQLEKLGLRILSRIAYHMPLTWTELLATALLNHTRRGIDYVALMARVDRLRRLFESVGRQLLGDDERLEDALALFCQEKYLVAHFERDRRIYAINESRRLGLDYFKNAALTPLVPEAMLACACRSLPAGRMERAQLEARFRFLYELWGEEFIFELEVGNDGYFRRALDRLLALGILTADGPDALELAPAGRLLFEELQGLLQACLEAWYVVLWTVAVLKDERIRQKELTQRVQEQARAMYMTGELERKEATSHLTLKNALQRLRALGMIAETTSSAGESGRHDPLLVLDEKKWQAAYEAMREIMGLKPGDP